MEETPQETQSITSMVTPITTAQRTYKRSARHATTERPAEKQASVLMKKYGVKRTRAGILLFPCTITQDQAAEVRAALKR